MRTDGSDGGPAFPDPMRADHEERVTDDQLGMSLRDWFAGQALAGLMASDRRWPNGKADTALAAYSLADAMIKARDL